MTTTHRHLLLLVFTCGIVFFGNLGAARLFDEDEPKNAECGREMFERGDWVVPTYNYELRTDKPIMLYWLMLTSFNVLGVSEFAARLPSAIMATITILSVYLIGRRLFEPKVGFWSAIILASSLMYVTSGRISTPDATLIAFITLSLLVFVKTISRTENGWATDAEASPKQMTWLPSGWGPYVAMYAMMGLAVLTKGPVGFLLPCTVIGLYLMCRDNAPHRATNLSWRRPLESANEILSYLCAFMAPSRFFHALRTMRPLTLFGVVAAIALPWYFAVGFATNGEWIAGFLGGHNVGRFSSAMEGHSGPIFYYVIAILMGFFPWSVFLPITLYLASQKQGEHRRDRFALQFLLCWVGVYLVFFSIAQTKLPNYVLPCYPPLALLTGWMLVRWQAARLALPNWALQWSSHSLIITGVALIVALPIVDRLLLPGYWAVGLVGLIPLAMGIWMRMQRTQPTRQWLLPGFGVGAICFVFAMLGVIAPWVSTAQESSSLGEQAARISDAETSFATFNYFAPNLPFYAQRHVQQLHHAEEVEQYFASQPEGILCVREDHWDLIEDSLPEDISVKSKTKRFLRDQNVYLLQRKLQASQTARQLDADRVLR